MKKDVHPPYHKVLFVDSASGYRFICGTTLQPAAKEVFEGVEYPVSYLSISSSSHPFFTGSKQLVDSEGRVEKFRKRFGRKHDALKDESQNDGSQEDGSQKDGSQKDAKKESSSGQSEAKVLKQPKAPELSSAQNKKPAGDKKPTEQSAGQNKKPASDKKPSQQPPAQNKKPVADKKAAKPTKKK